MGSIDTVVYRNQVANAIPTDSPASAVQASRDSLAGATAISEGLSEQVGKTLLNGVKSLRAGCTLLQLPAAPS
ncbi:hypothetical protein [Paenibacillus guangzhouensis]|uniref:hypothetical protein n=1 Tax=Paenibacillus guangzhouensis TaxID=1473112 RepID=UPI001266B35D|nr:hypothetical protein [Paenibacillus guangzhouensis]